MQDVVSKLKYRLARFNELLREEEANGNGEAQFDKQVRKQYLSGKISGLTEALDILEGREIKEKQP